MSARKLLILVPAVLLALAIPLPSAHASEINQMNILTFSQPIRIPSLDGAMVDLAPGTYTFQVIPSVANTNLVQVFDSRHEVVATIPTVSTEVSSGELYSRGTDTGLLTFAEGARNEPLTLIKWYYPGRIIGHEFVYSGPMEKQLSEERLITVRPHNFG